MKKEDITFSLFAFPLVLTACLDDEEPLPPRVFFVSPAQGDETPTELIVRFGVANFVVQPAGSIEDGSGYINLFIDTPCALEGDTIVPSPSIVTLSGGETEIALELSPGRHSLCIQLSNGAGVALPFADIIEIEVLAAEISIVSPREGEATGREVVVEMAARGLIVEKSGTSRPGAGHFYLAVDEDCLAEGESLATRPSVINLDSGETSTRLGLSRGDHTLCLGFADGDDVALAHRARVSFYAYGF